MLNAGALPRFPTLQAKLANIFTPQFTLLVLVSLLLVTVEGLNRGKSIGFGGESDDTEILSFGPYFAWITLPFFVIYAQSVRIRVSEALLLWLLLGSVVYDKSFAYTKLPVLPIYVTDLVLAFCFFDLWKRQAIKFRDISRIEQIFYLLFLAAGCLAAARGFLGGQDRSKTVRDFAIVLYPAYVLVGVSIFRCWASIQRYLVVGALGAVLASINAFFWFITTPDMRRYIQAPVYVQTVFVAAILLKIRGWKGWKSNLLIACCALGLLLGNARSTDLVAAVALALILVASAILWKGISWVLIRTVSVTAVTIILLIVLVLQTEAGQKFFEKSTDQIVSGVNYEDDANAIFRFLAWAEAYRRFDESPIVGEGYGIPFVFALADNDPRPHNTYLTVLYKMGIVGFLPLAAILFEYYRRSMRGLYQLRNLQRSTWLLLVLSIQFSFCAYGALNLLLESPFLASLFWINIGMTVSVMLLLRKEAELQQSHLHNPSRSA
jgi:O-antigen ligase